MSRQRYRTHVYILLLAVIIAAIAAYYLPGDRPQVASVHSYKEYIRLVEEKHEQRLKQRTEKDASTATEAPD
jgi:hypothetical protein